MEIREYIAALISKGLQGTDIAEILGVSVSMVSAYKGGSYNSSLAVAKRLYKRENLVFHPYSEEALKKEIAKDKL